MAHGDQTLARLGIRAPSRGAVRARRVGTVVVVLAAAGVAAYFFFGRPAAPPRYTTARIARGDLVASVTATGELSPLHTVDVGAQISGTISAVHVEVNARVHVGDVLAEIDTTELAAAVAEARANVSSAAAALESARTTLAEASASAARTTALRERDLATAAALESAVASAARAEAEVSGARARLSVARASLERAQIDLGRARILSPIDGVVLVRSIEEGQTVAASFSTPVLFQIAEDLARMELHVDVDEADVGRVREGQRATFVVDAYEERTFEATITRLHFASHLVDRVVAYEAVLSVDNADLALRPGMTATATIETDRRSGVLLVPNRALRFSPPVAARFGGPRPVAPDGPRVFVLEAGAPRAMPVTVGGTDGTSTEVTGDGVTEGLEVVLGLEAEPSP